MDNASCSINIPLWKNIKSFSLVAVIPLGADAVTALLKLAVVEFVITALFAELFLKYCDLVVVPEKLCFAAYSVITAVCDASANVESLLISFTLYPFIPNEPLNTKLPVL